MIESISKEERRLKYLTEHPTFQYFDPIKKFANAQIWIERRAGRLKRQPCFKCGSNQVEAHHHDYLKPIDVIWTCKTHHRELDKRRKLGLSAF